MQKTTTDVPSLNKAAWVIAILLCIYQPMIAQARDKNEELFWHSVECKEKPQVDLYLETYPAGAYISTARACLKSETIRRQLLQCEAHFKADRLLTGQGGNALDCYKSVLQSDVGNAQALAGITAIEDKYIAWIGRALERHNVGRAERYLRKLKTVNTERVEVIQLERRIIDEKKRAEARRKAREAEARRKAREAEARRKVQRLTGKMVAIPGGSFHMGKSRGDSSGSDDEKPVHTVNISPFQMSLYEVTVGQFRIFIADSDYTGVAGNKCSIYEKQRWRGRSDRNWDSPGFTQDDTHPVVCVTYNDAQAFIRWLNAKTGGNYRLPTEAEWEYAARAGTTSRYSWGDSKRQAGAYAWNSGDRTHTVGGKKPNPWGLYDMHGNVVEWVQDWYGKNYYARSPASDPQGPRSGTQRVLRGGSWVNFAGSLRSSSRSAWSPDSRSGTIGFRLVRQP